MYNNQNIRVKEKPKSFNNQTCLIIKLEYDDSLFYNLFTYT